MTATQEVNSERSVTVILDRIIYQKGKWCIVKVTNIENKKTFNAKGSISEPMTGRRYVLSGKPERNEKYNCWDLVISKSTLLENTNELGVTSLLKRYDGVGESKASLIYSEYGDDAIDKISKENPSELAKKLSISTRQAQEIIDSFFLHNRESKMSAAMLNIGLTDFQVKKFVSEFGDKALDEIKRDCFQLSKLDGIGYLTCSKIADKLGIPKSDYGRVRAGILYTVKKICESGDSYVDWYDLISKSVKLIGCNKNSVVDVVKKMVEKGDLSTRKTKPHIKDSELAKAFDLDRAVEISVSEQTN